MRGQRAHRTERSQLPAARQGGQRWNLTDAGRVTAEPVAADELAATVVSAEWHRPLWAEFAAEPGLGHLCCVKSRQFFQ